MIFFDTCVWIELLVVRTPVKTHERRRAEAASDLLNKALSNEENIITCKEQMLELISAIEKVKMKTVNKMRKQNREAGINNLKEFRMSQEFKATKELCESVISDVMHFATVNDIGEYNIDAILQRLELADINDCLYYDYCVKTGIDFYTFDFDLTRLGYTKVLHSFNVELGIWE